jgi:hypothetical protein
MTDQRSSRLRRVALIAALGLALAACSGAAAPPASPSGDPGTGSGGNIGGGGGVVIDPTPGDPAAGQPRIVVPRAGQKDTHPVGAMRLQASVDGRHVLVKVTWYSGVEPCNVLDSVRVERSGTDVAITLIEGASQVDVACIEIAELKATIVDLGDLEPGPYTIRTTTGEAPPIAVTIE